MALTMVRRSGWMVSAFPPLLVLVLLHLLLVDLGSSAPAKRDIEQASCSSAEGSIKGKVLVIDLPGCDTAHRVADRCGQACDLVLCAAWEIEVPSEPIPNTPQGYKELFSGKVRGVSLGDVPSLRKQSLDLLLIKHTKVESAVDQKFEIESTIGMAWSLIKPGGSIAIVSDAEQLIVVSNADGELFLDYADYPGALGASAKELGLGPVVPAKCPFWDKKVGQQITIARRPSSAGSRGEGGDEGPREGTLLQHVYIVGDAEGSSGEGAKELVFRSWGLGDESVTFVKPTTMNGGLASASCNQGAGADTCAGGEAAQQAAPYRASGLLAALELMLDDAIESSLIIFDTLLPDKALIDSISNYELKLDPDWGVLVGDEPSHFPSSFPAGAAAFWSVRGARALLSSANSCCPHFDSEVARALIQGNVSVAVASPTFASRQGSGSHDGDSSVTHGRGARRGARSMEQSIKGVAGSGQDKAAGVKAGSKLDRVPCRLFSFFDCHAEYAWDECVAKRDACESGASEL